MGILSKIKVGRKSDRNFFDLSHDVNTTSDFGFCQPTLIQNIVADSKINLKTSSFVRLAPLPVPTFGRINVKQHTAFVPYRDVFLAYDNFQSGKPVQSAVRHYTPYKADTMVNSHIFSFLMNISRIEANYGSLDTLKNNLYFKVNAFVKTSVAPEDTLDRDAFYDPINSKEDFDYLDENRFFNMVAIYQKLFNDASGQRSLFNQLFNDTFFNYYNYLDENYTTSNSGNFNWLNFIDVQLWRDYYNWIENTTPGLKDAFGDGAHRYLYDLPEYEIPFFSESVSIENADFVFHPENVDIELGMMDSGGELVYKHIRDVIFTIKLTPLGRRLFKIFNADGINFGMKNIPCDVLSLYSYYKSWFDKYNPGRNMQWLDTNCYYLIHGYYDFGRTLDDIYIVDSFREGDVAFYTADYKKHLRDFFSDLANCCYTLPVDNITVATNELLTNVSDTQINDISILQAGSSVRNNVNRQSVQGDNEQPYGVAMDVTESGGLGIKLLERIYHLVNKNSVIGSRIDEYLKAHNLGSPLPESLVLGDSDFSVMVEDTYSTAETEQAQLGEFAGKGKQYNDGDFMKFETANAGVLVQFVCIVPYGGYVQSGRKAMVDRYDFYNAFYDSLGKEAMTKYDVLSRVYLLDKVEEDSLYGFVPQYFHHKVRNNLANGGFAFRSQMSQFLPYSLDRIFTVPDLYIDKVRVWSSARREYVMVDKVRETSDLNIQADEYLRFIGRNEGFGNYNRIFYDTTGLTDNFILQMVHDFKVFSPMKPVSESFDTYDKDVDNGYTEVSHS